MSSASARGTSVAARLLRVVVALVLVSFPDVARAQQDAASTSSASTDFSFVKGLLLASAVGRAARADGSVGLFDGLAGAGTRRLAGSDATADEEAAATTADTGAEGDGGRDGGNLLANSLLLNRLRANLRDDSAEVSLASLNFDEKTTNA